jgi:hypothetical protein
MKPHALVPAVALVFALTSVIGCGLLKKKKLASDDESTTNAPTVTVSGTGAKNEKDVLRYKNETPIADEPAVIGKDGVKAKTFPSTGADIATIPKGATVVKKAKFFSTGILVTFDDPGTGDGTKLMGWIAPEALGPPTVATAPHVLTAAPKVTPGDAGAKDSGIAVADAGKPAVADTGGGTGRPTGLIAALPVGTKCPAGMTLVQGQQPPCRRPCSKDDDCPSGASCSQSGGRKICAIR